MKIFVKVKPRSKTERMEKLDKTHYVVSVKEPPVDNKANEAVVAALAKYFSIPRRQVQLVSGHTSRHKSFNIRSATSASLR